MKSFAAGILGTQPLEVCRNESSAREGGILGWIGLLLACCGYGCFEAEMSYSTYGWGDS
jgi:hypothetical protein